MEPEMLFDLVGMLTFAITKSMTPAQRAEVERSLMTFSQIPAMPPENAARLRRLARAVQEAEKESRQPSGATTQSN